MHGAFCVLLICEAAVGAVALVIVQLFPRQLIGIFGAANESEAYTEFAVKAFRTYLCLMPLATVNKGTFIYLQSVGKALASTMISLVREVAFGVGSAPLRPIWFGLDGVLYTVPVSDLLTFSIAIRVIAATLSPAFRSGAGTRHSKSKACKRRSFNRYDLCVNTDQFPPEKAADLIVTAAKKKKTSNIMIELT